MEKNLKAQLEEILRRKGVGSTPERLGELALELQKRSRAAPCRYFSALVPGCKLGYELDCLNCPQYVPHESPGPLPGAICEFEGGRVYHLMKAAESDGFWRWGVTLCGRLVDEEGQDVEIYPGGETLSQRRLCRRCQRERDKMGEEL